MNQNSKNDEETKFIKSKFLLDEMNKEKNEYKFYRGVYNPKDPLGGSLGNFWR